MKLGFAGGAQEVGGSCICLRIGEYGILLDSGIRQGGSRDPLPDFHLIQEMGGIDAILISHAHMDHIGSLPVISRAFPQAPIYMTPMSMDLTRVLLQDSLKIMSMREEEIPIYGEAEVSAMMERIVPLNELLEREILPGIRVVFYPAGHIAGAACIYLSTQEGSVFYSGDFASFPQQSIDGIHIPRLRPDLCIVESTYGDRLHSNRQVEENRLIHLVGEAVSAGKKILIPSFALGRSQEVILLLRTGINKGLIPPVPVYVDGMVRDICRIYHFHPNCLRNKLARSIMKGYDPFYSKEVRPVLPSEDRGELVEQDGPAVFVASSGMLSGGPSVLYAEKIISREDGMIILTGYQDEEAPGRALMQLAESADAFRSPDAGTEAPTFTLAGRSIPVRAGVFKVGLSAHGDQSEILGLLTRLSPRDVFLVHGDASALPSLARMVTGEYLRDVHVPRCGEIKEISYRTPRRQSQRKWPWTLAETDTPDENGMAELRLFVLEHYPEREWTAIQLIEIWYGRAPSDSDEIALWQKLLLRSAYFMSGEIHFFLFHPSTEEEMSFSSNPKEMTIQEIEKYVEKNFSELGYKKIGFHPDERRVVLRFLFPDAVAQKAFSTALENFRSDTEWTASIFPATNHNSAQMFLRQLLGDRIAKISYFESDKSYQVSVSGGKPEDSSVIEKFKSETGWTLNLSVDSSKSAAAGSSNNPFLAVKPDKVGKITEQNEALNYIKTFCAEEKIPLQRLGIKSDGQGRYIEMTFITPQIGKRYADMISAVSNDIGWRLVISSAVLQNMVFSVAAAAAEKAGLVLKKNPSYMPANREIQLKVSESVSEEVRNAVISEVAEKTGLACRIVM